MTHPLVKLTDDLWIRPKLVERIDAYDGEPEERGGWRNRKLLKAASLPSVWIRFTDGSHVYYPADSYDAACVEAARIAGIVNDETPLGSGTQP